MKLPTLILYMAINVTMVAVVVVIFALMCCGYLIFIFSPFLLLLPLLRGILFALLLCSTWFPFLQAHFFQLLCLYTSLIHWYRFENNITCSCIWHSRAPKYLRSTYRFFREISRIMAIFLKFVVYSHTLCPGFFLNLWPDPLVLFIPNRVKMWLCDGFEALQLSHWMFSLQPQGLCVDFPPS